MGCRTFIRNSKPYRETQLSVQYYDTFQETKSVCVSYLSNNQVVTEILVLHIIWRERGKILKYAAFSGE